MKLKLIQLTGLFAFVVVILMLAPPDKGFGGEPWEHIPDLWINSSGYLSTPDNPGTHLIGKAEDPRNKNFNSMCGSNGDETVSGFAWYYRGGMIDDPSQHVKNPTMPNHNKHFKQNVYKLYLSGSASTSANGASGSLDPGIKDPESIDLPAAHTTRSFKGQGSITLDIPAIDYHVPKYDYSNRYVGCETKTAERHCFIPGEVEENGVVKKEEEVIKVLVNLKNVSDKRTATISVGGEVKGATANFTHTWEWGGTFFRTRGRGFGMRVSVGGWWTAYQNEELKLQGKTAQVYGKIQDAELPTLNAEFDTKNSWCPPDNGYSQTQRKYIPHVSAEYPIRVK